MAKPGFNGEATREELYDIFRVMLNYAKKPIEPTPQQNYVNYQQYPQMQTQYINQNYNPYLQMQAQQQQPQYTAYNTMANMGQTAYTYNGQNGQVWGYPSYMGMNSYGYRQWFLLFLMFYTSIRIVTLYSFGNILGEIKNKPTLYYDFET